MYNSKTVKKFIDAIDINKDNWENMSLTNCYAYALGIDLDIGFRIIELGEISGFNYKIRNYSDIETALLMDCIRLNLNIEKVKSDYYLKNDNSWLIAMYMTPFYYDKDNDNKTYDYHFLRKTKNMNWTHKIGDTNIITNKDESDLKINDPACASLFLDSNIKYNYIGSYLLTKK